MGIAGSRQLQAVGSASEQRPAPPKVRLTGIEKRFGDVLALEEVDLEVASGEILVLIGASGSGKTTLLRCLVGLEEITGGFIEIDGETVVDLRPGKSNPSARTARNIRHRRLGMVFQAFNLFPHRTVLENIIEAPVHVVGTPKSEAIAEARRLLALVGLSDREHHYPRQLSGGQQQRAAIARALATHPDVLLFDEVTSALDPELTAEVLAVMTDLGRRGQTMIVVTHEMAFANQVADRVVFMDSGRIVEQGRPDQVLSRPREERTQRFLSKVLHLDIAARDDDRRG